MKYSILRGYVMPSIMPLKLCIIHVISVTLNRIFSYRLTYGDTLYCQPWAWSFDFKVIVLKMLENENRYHWNVGLTSLPGKEPIFPKNYQSIKHTIVHTNHAPAACQTISAPGSSVFISVKGDLFHRNVPKSQITNSLQTFIINKKKKFNCVRGDHGQDKRDTDYRIISPLLIELFLCAV